MGIERYRFRSAHIYFYEMVVLMETCNILTYSGCVIRFCLSYKIFHRWIYCKYWQMFTQVYLPESGYIILIWKILVYIMYYGIYVYSILKYNFLPSVSMFWASSEGLSWPQSPTRQICTTRSCLSGTRSASLRPISNWRTRPRPGWLVTMVNCEDSRMENASTTKNRL